MQVLEKLNVKKGLIVTALSMAVMLGAYASQYYGWTEGYEITPLTESVRIAIPVKNFKFETYVEMSPKIDAKITTFKPNTKVYFRVNETPYGATLGKVFYNVDVMIKVDGQYAILTLVNNNRWWGNGDIEAYLVLPSPVTEAPLEITVVANAALHGTVSEIFELIVWLVETD